MKHVVKLVHNAEDKFGIITMYAMRIHPYLSFLYILIGMPILLLAAVFASTSVVMLPIAMFCGWM